MKNMNVYTILLFASLLLGACEKSTPAPPEPPEEVEEILEIEWATRLDNTREVVTLANGISYKDWFIYFGDLDEPPTVKGFNKTTGDKDWEVILSDLEGSEITYSYLHENVLIARTNYLVFGFDLDTQALLWDVNFILQGIRLGRGVVGENGLFYQLGVLNFNPSGGGTQKMFEMNPFTGEYTEVYSRSPDELGTKTISPPVVEIQGDRTLLIFNERPNGETPPEQTIQYLVAMDLESGERVWETLVTPIFASNSLHPPVIYDDRIVITGGHDKIYGFDIDTGARLWTYQDENAIGLAQWGKTNHLIHGDKLYVNETGEDVTCLNPETGDMIWDNIKGGANCSDNMFYYEKEDLLVFCSWGYGSVMLLDALTGKTVHRERRYDDSSYNSDVVYDEERDMFYCTTFRHAVGFTVKRP